MAAGQEHPDTRGHGHMEAMKLRLSRPTIHESEFSVWLEGVRMAALVPGDFVEIGVAEAAGTKAILRALDWLGEKRVVWSIDIDERCRQTHEWMATTWARGSDARFVLGKSADVAAEFDRDVAWVFVDGAHNEAAVRADLQGWTPKVVRGGVVLIHDTGIKAVRRAIDKFRGFADEFELVREVDAPPPVLGIRLYRRRTDP